MEIDYTVYLRLRLKHRDIPKEWPKEIIEEAETCYWDVQESHYIAVGQRYYKGKMREMMVIFDRRGDRVEAISISPLGAGQKEKRIKSGRWIEHEG